MGNRDEIKREAKEAAREAKEAAKEAVKEAAGNIDDLRREAEEAKERIRRDIEEARDILRRIAEESALVGAGKAEKAVRRAEKWIERMTNRVDKRFSGLMTRIIWASEDNDTVVTREFDFSDFTNVEVSHAFRVDIIRSDSYQVSITASARLFDYIDVTKSGNTLKISRKPFQFPARTAPEARIAMPILNKLRLSGATKGTVAGFSSQEDFDLNVSGASGLDIDMEAGKTKLEISGASRVSGNVKVADAEFTLSGASRAKLSGSVNNIVLNAWGASRLDLADFTLNDTSVSLKGASRATCGECCGNLDLDLSGASKLDYCGNPTMRDINVSGASTLSHKNK